MLYLRAIDSFGFPREIILKDFCKSELFARKNDELGFLDLFFEFLLFESSFCLVHNVLIQRNQFELK